MNTIIDVIVDQTFKKYGKNVLFREYEFNVITVNNTTAMYRVQSAINYPYVYEIQMHVFDKVKYSSSIFERFHRCLYCHGKHADYKMLCCNKYLHLKCGMDNKFSCCHLNRFLARREKSECCVCMEETSSVTECGHYLCQCCLEKMYKTTHKNRGQLSVSCPYCRNTIIEETYLTDYHNVRVNNKEEVVCISYI